MKIVNENSWRHASQITLFIVRSDKVGDGQECAVVEAMKMQNSLSSGVNIVKHILIIIRWDEQHTFKLHNKFLSEEKHLVPLTAGQPTEIFYSEGIFFKKFIQVTGVVKAVHVKEGDTVDEDQILVEIE